MKTTVCIIGAGPAGLMAAIFAARADAAVTVVEANTTAGRKLLRTGGGRCNFTHADSVSDFIRALGPCGRFLRYCLHEFTPQDAIVFFEDRGIRTRTEADGCVFPASDRASEIRDALTTEAQRMGARFLYDRKVEGLSKSSDGFFEVRTAREVITAEKVIIATGGVSWPDTGSCGDGYRFAKKIGHSVVEPRGILVPLLTREKWSHQLAGAALDTVAISTGAGSKKQTVTGAMLFTHDGIGGPAVLNLSRAIAERLPSYQSPVEILIDMAVDSNAGRLEQKIIELCTESPKKTLTSIMTQFVPRRLAVILCAQAGIGEELTCSRLNKDSRRSLVRLLKALPLSVTDRRPIKEATVTRGGVSTSEIEPRTMESKICPGLFFAGEVIDVDGPCGGYNLQICWSTGALAGRSAAVK